MRILLFGDIPGIPQLLRYFQSQYLVGIVCAVIRPQYHAILSEIARSHNLPLLIQPKVNSQDYPAFREAVNRLAPDLILVNSYSMIVRADALAIPCLGGINIHGGLLPKYRGCNPTQWAILKGESSTRVTMHEMSAALDEGPIIDRDESIVAIYNKIRALLPPAFYLDISGTRVPMPQQLTPWELAALKYGHVGGGGDGR